MSVLQSRAMLASLTVSCWTAMRKDDNVSKEVDKQHGADRAGLYRKHLVPKDALEGCQTAMRALRDHHNKLTLPWTDGGTRLLPTKLYREYDQKFIELRDAYYVEVDKFIALYDSTLRVEARKRLGTLYDINDYPPGQSLKSKFGVQLELTPVPSANDFRVDIGAEQVNRISKELNARMEERAKQATRESWVRVADVVGNVHVRLSAEKPIIRESLGEHVKELARLLPGLNLNDDPLLSDVAAKIAANLVLDLALLRKSGKERARVAQQAAAIMEMIPNEFRAVAEGSA